MEVEINEVDLNMVDAWLASATSSISSPSLEMGDDSLSVSSISSVSSMDSIGEQLHGLPLYIFERDEIEDYTRVPVHHLEIDHSSLMPMVRYGWRRISVLSNPDINGNRFANWFYEASIAYYRPAVDKIYWVPDTDHIVHTCSDGTIEHRSMDRFEVKRAPIQDWIHVKSFHRGLPVPRIGMIRTYHNSKWSYLLDNVYHCEARNHLIWNTFRDSYEKHNFSTNTRQLGPNQLLPNLRRWTLDKGEIELLFNELRNNGKNQRDIRSWVLSL